MSQLTDYKEKYPQYTKGMSDDQVLERLHKSYYNSQDFENSKQILLLMIMKQPQ